MTFDPSNSNRIYAGAAGGGLWRTINGGVSWAPLTDQLPFLAVTGVAVKPTNPMRIVVATGQGQGGSVRIDGVGVWRSTDAGRPGSRPRSSSSGRQERQVPSGGATVFAGSIDSLRCCSSDREATWTTVMSEECTDNIAFTGKLTAYAIQRGGAQPGIYRSTNNGLTWENRFTNSNSSRGRVAIAPSNPDIVYALLGHTDNEGWLGLYRSDDAGDN
ncbi:MAG: hypothetical protein R3E12_04520 [Candidatus Eisenbacteria bacterium]